MESNRSVQLGCGTLILIIIIVVVFGNVAAQDLQRDMAALRDEMRALRDSVQVLRKTVEELRETVAPGPDAARQTELMPDSGAPLAAPPPAHD